MTLGKVMDRDFVICSWIEKNFSAIKSINSKYSSAYLLTFIREDIPDINHEEFKQAMAHCGYYGDCSNCNEHYEKIYFNVSESSINKVREKNWRKKSNELNRKRETIPGDPGAGRT